MNIWKVFCGSVWVLKAWSFFCNIQSCWFSFTYLCFYMSSKSIRNTCMLWILLFVLAWSSLLWPFFDTVGPNFLQINPESLSVASKGVIPLGNLSLGKWTAWLTTSRRGERLHILVHIFWMEHIWAIFTLGRLTPPKIGCIILASPTSMLGFPQGRSRGMRWFRARSLNVSTFHRSPDTGGTGGTGSFRLDFFSTGLGIAIFTMWYPPVIS